MEQEKEQSTRLEVAINLATWMELETECWCEFINICSCHLKFLKEY